MVRSIVDRLTAKVGGKIATSAAMGWAAIPRRCRPPLPAGSRPRNEGRSTPQAGTRPRRWTEDASLASLVYTQTRPPSRGESRGGIRFLRRARSSRPRPARGPPNLAPHRGRPDLARARAPDLDAAARGLSLNSPKFRSVEAWRDQCPSEPRNSGPSSGLPKTSCAALSGGGHRSRSHDSLS
jgi:hypothetical protein